MEAEPWSGVPRTEAWRRGVTLRIVFFISGPAAPGGGPGAAASILSSG